ncbi:Serine protease 55 [Willisornis vidua]|uniref:Serine protease 55 n=1 Tax=Willisornis vidua TaxID=1566151 RepID=A0ABQ9DGI5_9PASS|nr:Serine protease 55 [Willisornis vidua]
MSSCPNSWWVLDVDCQGKSKAEDPLTQHKYVNGAMDCPGVKWSHGITKGMTKSAWINVLFQLAQLIVVGREEAPSDGKWPPDLTVVVGGIDLSVPLEEHQPDSLILHKNFNSTSMANDIALILLSSPIEFSKEKIPICLPFMCDIHIWQLCWAAGWGSTSAAEAVPASHVLHKARVKLISREQCLEQIPQLQENMMCAEVEEGEPGNCQVK